MNQSQDKARLTIRAATPDDAACISALILGLADFVVEDSEKENASAFLATLSGGATRERLESSGYRYFVCESEDGIQGVIGMKDRAHLYHLFVRSEFHGQGIARSLWDYVRARIDAPVITVNSSPFALSVYRKLGFVQTEAVQYQDGIKFIPMEYVND